MAKELIKDTKAAPSSVPASEFARNFGRYRVEARRKAVAVSSHGRIAGYFVAPEDYAEYERMKAQRRTFATADLDDKAVAAVAKSRMHSRHRHLDALLKSK
jgi:hypothetical protein